VLPDDLVPLRCKDGRHDTMSDRVPTFEEAMDAAAQALIDAVAARAGMSIPDAARAAWYPGHPLITVEALEAHIAERRERQQVRPAAAPADPSVA
jgi:hypothetical protein